MTKIKGFRKEVFPEKVLVFCYFERREKGLSMVYGLGCWSEVKELVVSLSEV